MFLPQELTIVRKKFCLTSGLEGANINRAGPCFIGTDKVKLFLPGGTSQVTNFCKLEKETSFKGNRYCWMVYFFAEFLQGRQLL